MAQPGTYLEAFEIDRPDKWLEEAAEEVGKFLALKADVLQQITLHFILENSPELVPFLVAIPPLNPAIVNLLKLNYHLGYFKGLANGEDRATRDQGLKEMLGEEG